MLKGSLSGNLSRLYVIKFSKWFMLVIPIMAMFYKENDLGPSALFILQGVYAVSTSVLEIPSGYLADAWGRKKSLILGSILGTAGYIIYVISHGFWGFLIAELILGVGLSFISGSDSALLYDSLLALKKEGQYLKYEGRITSFGNFFETAASLLGGILAGTLFLRAPFYAQIVVASIAIPASLSLVEPERHKFSTSSIMKNMFNIISNSLFKNKLLRVNIFFSSVIGCATLTMAWSVQIFGTYNHFNEFQITFLWVVLNLVVAFSALYAHRILKFSGEKIAIIIIGILIPGTYILTGFLNLFAIPVLVIFYLIRGIATPSLKGKINQSTDSSTRATVLSIRNLIIRLLFIFVGTSIGWITEKYDFLTAMKIGGIIFLVFSLFTGIPFFMRNKSKF